MESKIEDPVEVLDQAEEAQDQGHEQDQKEEQAEVQREDQVEAQTEGQVQEEHKEEQEKNINEAVGEFDNGKLEDKRDALNNETFIAKLEEKIEENQNLQNKLIQTKYQDLKSEVINYFASLKETMTKQIDETRDSVLAKVQNIVEMETGYVDWENFKEELEKKKAVYKEAQDIVSQKQSFDAYFEYYNRLNSKIETVNKAAYNTIDNTANLFKFDQIVLNNFMVNFKSICTVLESDFVTNVSFTANYLDPTKMRLEELVQVPHPGVWCATERIDKLGVFILGGRDGRVSMYDSKTLRVLDAVQGIKMFVSCLLYIPQYNTLLIGGADSQVAVRRLEGRSFGKHLASIEAEGYVTYLKFIEEENLIVSIGTDPNIRLYHPTSLVLVGKIPMPIPGSKPRGGAQYIPSKKLLLVGYDDGMFQFFNMKTRQLAFAIFGEGTAYWGLEYHEPTQKIYGHISPNLIKVWDFKGDRPGDERPIVLEGEGDKPFNIKIVDKYLFSASNNEKIVVYDIEQRKTVKKIDVPSFKCQTLMILPREGRLIVADEDSSKIASIKIL